VSRIDILKLFMSGAGHIAGEGGLVPGPPRFVRGKLLTSPKLLRFIFCMCISCAAFEGIGLVNNKQQGTTTTTTTSGVACVD